ncbi:MAG: NAD(P)H-binding protein [candidate division Zixibacteria bacterium]|nr:NAD(P)H-binding protein [candidate division Zixibacteria bacterium]MBU1471495.1 NAD(P)H-binding protein [candidate division Zixibacteria bacterium]
MTSASIHAVTGAFGYTGKYIANELLDKGYSVITLTNSADRSNEFAGRVKAFPFDFDEPDELANSLRNVEVLYNTYWVRFNHRLFKHCDAVENTLVLFEAALKAGVRRIVHVSITNPSEESPLEYFSGKAKLEKALIERGLSYAILRPTVVFGREDILINNIAWMLRKFPLFGVFGDGGYRLQPIYVQDLAELAVDWGARNENSIVNAIGPENFTYRELVETVGRLIGVNRRIISIPPTLGYLTGRILSMFKGDVTITREEIEGLMADLLHVDTPPTGSTKLTDWIKEHSSTVGMQYTSELARRLDRQAAYKSN